jgi:hypothetical protein
MEPQDTLARIRQLIAADELELAISELGHYLGPNSPRLDEAIMQSAQHQDVMRQIRLGIADEQQATLAKNKIRTGLLDLIRALEKRDEFTPTSLADYHRITAKIGTNRGLGTSEVLDSKTIADLDKQELAELFTKERVIRLLALGDTKGQLRTHQAQLVQLSLAENGHLYKGTFLCLGKRNQIQSICPSATEAKFIRFKGTGREIILELETLYGPLMQQFEGIVRLLRQHIPLGRDRATSQDIYEIPLVAVREFLANAFIHRDYGQHVQSYIQVEMYDDRLEIKSPGHLPEGMDVSKVEATVLRNPVVAAVFHLYGYIERAGTGIQVAQQALKAAGLAPARIENIDHPRMVKVTIQRPVYEPPVARDPEPEQRRSFLARLWASLFS